MAIVTLFFPLLFPSSYQSPSNKVLCWTLVIKYNLIFWTGLWAFQSRLEMAVFGFVKFQVCLKSSNISFEPEFGNPRIETQKNLNVFNFQLTRFSAIVDFIIWFCASLSRETCSFVIISQLFLFYAQQQKEGFQTQLFKTWVLTQPDFENPKKNPFQT